MAVDMKTLLTNLLAALSENSSPSNITELKTILATARPEAIYVNVRNTDLAPLFNFLQTHHGVEHEDLIEIFGKLLDSFPSKVLMSAMKIQITRTLKCNSTALKGVLLRQLIRCCKDNSTLCDVATDRHLLESVVQLLGDEDTWTSKQSAAILKEVTREKEALSALLHPPLTKVMGEVMDRGDIYRFRVHDVLVDVAKASRENMERVVESGCLKCLLDEMNGNDILVKLNALELLTDLAATPHGLDYLEKVGMVNKLRDNIMALSADPLASFLAPGLLKFFGNIGLSSPQRLVSRYPQVLDFILDCVQESDLSCQLVSIETVGVISASTQGKCSLKQFDNKMKMYMKKLRENINGTKNEIRVRSLGALANVLHVEEPSEDMLALTEAWYGALGDGSTKLLLQICKQPFPDLRCGALAVLRELALQAWGQDVLLAQPGFLEYLLDRSTEPDKEGKEAKFTVVAAFVQSRMPSRRIAAEDLERLMSYYREGPFHSEAVTAVAFEGAT
ncbi:26S proteasome non-ATPase regulatory subunit 5-like [Ornithodoros turicata]|uniref:26S proteasome non-ATPase regulatory subunit 5-like n=1 Tax=Ornithodoros turicata TaxID=34597 RepID=UPI003138C6BD